MRKILLTGALVAGLTCLAGCSDSDDDEEELISTITEILLTGSWLKCENDGAATSFSNLLTFNGDGTGGAIQTRFTDLNCVTPDAGMAPNIETLTYTIEADATVDGSIAGITAASEFNLSINGGAIEYTVIALTQSDPNLLTPDTLHFGDTSADSAKNGSAADKRPTTLESLDKVFDKQ